MTLAPYVLPQVGTGYYTTWNLQLDRHTAIGQQLIALYQHLYTVQAVDPEEDLLDEEGWHEQLDEMRQILEWLRMMLGDTRQVSRRAGVTDFVNRIIRLVNEEDFQSEMSDNVRGGYLAFLTSIASEGWIGFIEDRDHYNTARYNAARWFLEGALAVSAMSYAQSQLSEEFVDELNMVKRIHQHNLTYSWARLGGDGGLPGAETIMRTLETVSAYRRDREGRTPDFARDASAYRSAATTIRDVVALYIGEDLARVVEEGDEMVIPANYFDDWRPGVMVEDVGGVQAQNAWIADRVEELGLRNLARDMRADLWDGDLADDAAVAINEALGAAGRGHLHLYWSEGNLWLGQTNVRLTQSQRRMLRQIDRLIVKLVGGHPEEITWDNEHDEWEEHPNTILFQGDPSERKVYVLGDQLDRVWWALREVEESDFEEPVDEVWWAIGRGGDVPYEA